MSEQELIEALAEKEHASWARWQTYLHSLCERRGDGALVIPASRVNFWSWEAASAYEQLPDSLKQYDRDEVAYILPIIQQYAKDYSRQSDDDNEGVHRCECCGAPLLNPWDSKCSMCEESPG